MKKSNAHLVDAHCHVDLYPDMEALMRQCEDAQIATVAVTTTPRAWPKNRELARKYNYIEPALGLHPQLVGQFPSELSTWLSYAPEAHIIGEVGLDAGPKFYRSFELQKEVFDQVLQTCAKMGGKVLTVHSVRAASTVLDMIEKHLRGTRCSVVLHWFTGTASEAKRAVDLGCYFSINIEMLKKDNHINTVRSLPLERILTETDGPFTQNGRYPRTPLDIKHTVTALAVSANMDKQLLSSIIAENYDRLLNR